MYKITRRNLLIKSLQGGLSLSALHPMLSLADVISFDEDEQMALEAKADHVLTFGSPYDSANYAFSPHMHQEFKHNIQTMSNGKIFVKILDKGQAGIGPKLMVAVARGKVSAGLVSMANLSPIAPELDVLNIPFWSASNERYINLVTSPVWEKVVLNKIRGDGKIDVLFHYAVGPRTVSTVKSYGKQVLVPSDLKHVVFRVPASATLQVFYGLAGASPRKIAWGKTADAARKKMFQALDPGLIGLYNGPDNLKQELSYITRAQTVHDGWAAVVNQKWMNSLPGDLQEVVRQASAKTFQQQIEKTAQITDKCIKYFELAGTKVVMPSAEDKQKWIDQCGHQRSEWLPVKKKILGDVKIFDQLVEATKNTA